MLLDGPSLPPPTKKPALAISTPITTVPLRRSPRKQTQTTANSDLINGLGSIPEVTASSFQRQASPGKATTATRSPLKQTQSRARTAKLDIFDDVPDLFGSTADKNSRTGQAPNLRDDAMDELLGSMGSVSLELKKPVVYEVSDDSDIENNIPTSRRSPTKASRKNSSVRPLPTSTMSRITQAAKGSKSKRAGRGAAGAQYVLKEAHCEDLDESSGTDGEEEDTDLSGFIVADDEDLTVYEDDDELEEQNSSSDEEDKRRRRRTKRVDEQVNNTKTRGKLQRGHRRQLSEPDEEDSGVLTLDDGLVKALSGMKIGEGKLRAQRDQERRQTIEVVDLTSSPIQEEKQGYEETKSSTRPTELSFQLSDTSSNEFDSTIQLKPTTLTSLTTLLPSKTLPAKLHQSQSFLDDQIKPEQITQSTTPPATPPRPSSPSKLKSPSKLQLSPSKRNGSIRSPHRQSMDAFWDHNVINEFNDTFSPKKAPTASPRKNPLSRFELWTNDDAPGLDSEDDLSKDSLDDSEDSSLPSPCESPTKKYAGGRIASPSKAEKDERKRLADEKRAKVAKKKDFDAKKEQMANELLQALDENVTGSKIAQMVAGTGGVQVIWSKTLRSTAGRANWKRTVTKPSGSPIKGDPASKEVEKQTGVVVQHFANIELAEKVIDREDRLINTLSHEFCHLANFMVSGIRDQPHGASFQQWGAKVTAWMRSQKSHPEWKSVEVTTKHGYVIEHKYLWVCVGRPQSLSMKMLEIDEEGGCGAEYGRHSKSIDAETQRCGRCKGKLMQVRPAPRAAPASPRKNNLRSPRKAKSGMSVLERMIEVVDLSD